ncbi:hypothetical protein GCM10011571_29230 [Marinithermofilum abyssi]|uniref:Uncharacterized protein n=1 Tax=Marinithermofilum abyssi TaxID=1571185 RepID=A0A8J2YDD1_9BACL|nr:hypothetical protein [Marinithermofilum abyssi]GGE25209.1 hypothetical protein GCM10011571_29230 [Marinithermofilum abyssi]
MNTILLLGIGMLVILAGVQTVLLYRYLRQQHHMLQKQQELLQYWLERPRRVEKNLMKHHQTLLASDLDELDGSVERLLKRSEKWVGKSKQGSSTPHR